MKKNRAGYMKRVVERAAARRKSLRDANLGYANLNDAKWNYVTIGLQPAPEGELIGYKQLASGTICKLRIPADARRSCATTRKFRAECAVVLEGEGGSDHDPDFIYRVGETVSVSDFDTDRWNECSRGIHFFLSREEAEAW
jgi:hypothetical protein